ncbi:MAG: hypothetical protein HYW47_02735 [Deltaproteobacteria bacterium]|nr:hypothetical protein [Deltaproteobacteria bacterium]
MKKIFLVFIGTILLGALVACGNEELLRSAASTGVPNNSNTATIVR